MKRPLPIDYAKGARRDLVELWLDYASVSEDLSRKILTRLEMKIQELAQHPQLGRLRPEFQIEGLRSIAVNPHVIFYTISSRPSVWIYRVVDGRRSLASLFGHE